MKKEIEVREGRVKREVKVAKRLKKEAPGSWGKGVEAINWQYGWRGSSGALEGGQRW